MYSVPNTKKVFLFSSLYLYYLRVYSFFIKRGKDGPNIIVKPWSTFRSARKYLHLISRYKNIKKVDILNASYSLQTPVNKNLYTVYNQQLPATELHTTENYKHLRQQWGIYDENNNSHTLITLFFKIQARLPLLSAERRLPHATRSGKRWGQRARRFVVGS